MQIEKHTENSVLDKCIAAVPSPANTHKKRVHIHKTYMCVF